MRVNHVAATYDNSSYDQAHAVFEDSGKEFTDAYNDEMNSDMHASIQKQAQLGESFDGILRRMGG